jgi:hypothetical protein
MEHWLHMRYGILVTLSGVWLAAQSQPNCTGVALDVDARCACVKFPNSDSCALVKSGLYEHLEHPDWAKLKPANSGLVGTIAPPAARAATPARPQKARVVPLAHKDYLRFLHPNAQLAVGFDFEKMFQSPELMAAVFGQADGPDDRNKLTGALKEMDHLWLSVAPPNDVVLLMTGKFEQGVTAGMFYAQGVQPVFLGDAHAMLIGSEPSIQGALARLAKPAAAGGWVARRARELSKDHETWIVTEPPPAANQTASIFSAIRRFAMGIRLSGTAAIDGEVATDSDAGAEKIAAWVDRMKAAIREKTGVGALDALAVERAGATLRFTATDNALLSGDAGKTAMNSDVGVELYSLIMAGFPGAPARTVAQDKLLSVKAGMKREEVLNLLGPPLTVSSIQGLDTPRETWTYQVPFGKQFTVRLDSGIVTAPAR